MAMQPGLHAQSKQGAKVVLEHRLYRTLSVLVTTGAVAAVMLWPSAGRTQQLSRLAAEYNYFGTEISTTLNARSNPTRSQLSGIPVYTRTLKVPSGSNVIFATISATGDAHGGAGSCFTALLDGKYFNPGAQGSGECADGQEVPGWVTLLKIPAATDATNCNDGGGGPGDCHDNAIHHEWCRTVTPGTHTVQIRMATTNSGNAAFIEQAFFYVDSAKMTSLGCVQAATPSAPGLVLHPTGCQK